MGASRKRNDGKTPGVFKTAEFVIKQESAMLTASEVERMLGVSSYALRRMVDRGAFPPPSNKGIECHGDEKARASWQRTVRRWPRKLVEDFINGRLIAILPSMNHKLDWAEHMMIGDQA